MKVVRQILFTALILCWAAVPGSCLQSCPAPTSRPHGNQSPSQRHPHADDPAPVPTPTLLQLPASARLGAVLTGSGAVQRSLLTFDDLMTGHASAPVDDSAFALPEEAAMPEVVFEGRLQLSSGNRSRRMESGPG